MTNEQMPPSPALDRALAYVLVGVIALSLLAFLAIIVGTAMGAAEGEGMSQGLWPAIIVTPLFGLPLGFVLLIVLIVRNMLRRRRADR